MKFPQITTYLVMIMYMYVGHGQSQTLTTIPSALYVQEEFSDSNTFLESSSHDFLFKALKIADLEEILKLSGSFTFFAPTNNAFSKLSNDELKALFKSENRKKLKDLLTFHIVAGNLTASKILKAMCRGNGKASFTTVQGRKLFATMKGTDIVLSDGQGNQARITSADMNQSNGVIHQIDSIIVPAEM